MTKKRKRDVHDWLGSAPKGAIDQIWDGVVPHRKYTASPVARAAMLASARLGSLKQVLEVVSKADASKKPCMVLSMFYWISE